MRKLTKEQRDKLRERANNAWMTCSLEEYCPSEFDELLDDLDEADRELERLTDTSNRIMDENRYIRSLADGREEKLRAKLAEADKTIEQACEQLDQKDEQVGEMRKKLAVARDALEWYRDWSHNGTGAWNGQRAREALAAVDALRKEAT
jgi:septal ring factor EnvC (AmiA/AmiB activator)